MRRAGRRLAASGPVSRRRRASLVLAVAAAGCVVDPAAPLEPTSSRVLRLELPLRATPKLDVLFVLDNSTAMRPHVDLIAAMVPQWTSLLYYRDPSLHLGVTTTDLGEARARSTRSDAPQCASDGTGGRLRAPAAIDGDFFVDLAFADGTRTSNFTGTRTEALAALLDTGAAGCDAPQPLEAMRHALHTPGFLRDDALLAIVILSASDDAGRAPVSMYVDLLRALRPDGRVLINVVTGPCPSTSGGPAPSGSRLRAFADAFPHHGTKSYLCGSGIYVQFQHVGLGRPDGGDPCLAARLADADPDTPGRQLACAVELRSTHPDFDRLLPLCAGDARPCYRIAVDRESCPPPFGTRDVDFDSERLVIEHARVELPPGVQAIAECLAEPTAR